MIMAISSLLIGLQGNDSCVFFYEDLWIGDVLFVNLFPRHIAFVHAIMTMLVTSLFKWSDKSLGTFSLEILTIENMKK